MTNEKNSDIGTVSYTHLFNWAVYVEELSVKEGKKFFGGRCVLGGFDNRPESVLCSGTREEVEAFTRKWLEENNENGMMIGADRCV